MPMGDIMLGFRKLSTSILNLVNSFLDLAKNNFSLALSVSSLLLEGQGTLPRPV